MEIPSSIPKPNLDPENPKEPLKLESELETLKKILRRKEKRLKKFNRILNSKNHVHETINRHQVAEKLKSSQVCIAQKELQSNVIACELSVQYGKKATKSVSFEDDITASFCGTESTETLTTSESSLLDLKPAESKSDTNQALFIPNEIIQNEDKIVKAVNAENQNVVLSCENDYGRCKSGQSEIPSFGTPTLNRNKLKHSRDLSLSKRLFVSQCDNNESESLNSLKLSKPLLANESAFHLSQTAKVSISEKSETSKCAIENNFIVKKADENLVPLVFEEKSFNAFDDESSSQKSSDIQVIRSKYLMEEHLGDVITTHISYPLDDVPRVIFLCTKGVSIWSLLRDKNFPKNNSNLIWSKSFERETEDFQSLTLRNYCVFGGGASNQIYYIIVRGPLTEEEEINITYIQGSAKERELKILNKSIPIKICNECSLIGCNLHQWKFCVYVKPCKNCLYSGFKGAFFTVSFDVFYSLKEDQWDFVILDVREHVAMSDKPLESIQLLWNYDPCSDSSPEDQIFLWQDVSGALGLADAGSASSILLSKRGSEPLFSEVLQGGIIVFAAAVKEVLFLVVKTEEELKFLAVDPLCCQFDSLCQIPSRELKMSDSPSVIFFENKFFINSSDAVVVCLVL